MKYAEFKKQAAKLSNYPLESPEFTGTLGGLIVGAPIGAIIAGKGNRLAGAAKGGAAAALVGLGLGMLGRAEAEQYEDMTRKRDSAEQAFYDLLKKWKGIGLPTDDIRRP